MADTAHTYYNLTARGVVRRLVLSVCTIILILSVSTAVAQEAFVDREAQIKAAYIYQFIKYVQWPELAADTPIVIGTIGEDPVNHYLQLIAANRAAGKRRLKYLVASDTAQLQKCHILFVSASVDSSSYASLLGNVTDLPVLTVGERADFLSSGGVVSFVIVGNTVRINLSLENAKAKRLKISSQLAKIANVVRQP